MEKNEVLRREFAEMVTAMEKAAAQLARPWKISTAVLAAIVTVIAGRFLRGYTSGGNSRGLKMEGKGSGQLKNKKSADH